MAAEKETETPVLHVIVVGFHHKKGCQVMAAADGGDSVITTEPAGCLSIFTVDPSFVLIKLSYRGVD